MPRHLRKQARGVATADWSSDMRTIPLHGKIAAGRVALIDDEDYPLVSQHRWHAKDNTGPNRTISYACTCWGPSGGRTFAYMHNFIMGLVGIDHHDHDGLNNTRTNLRPATQSQNGANNRSMPGTSSQFRGVTWYRPTSRWRAAFCVKQHQVNLGYFDSEVDAARAYDVAAFAAWGEFATLNFPPGGNPA